MPRKNRRMRGGFLDSLESTLSGWGSSISQGASSAYSKTKNAVTSLGSNTAPTTQPMSSVGGRTRKNKRGGSFSASKSVTGMAANSASVSNVKTAQPHNVVGGSSLSAMKPATSSAPNTTSAPNSTSVSNVKTAQPHKTVGGKSKRHRKHKHTKSCKNMKH